MTAASPHPAPTPRAAGADPATARPIRLLVVDDSPTMRQLIRATVAPDRRIAVVGEAGDPFEAREMIKALAPDVITLDVEMPHMNGLDFLDRLMRLRPMPVVMISTETQRGSRAAIEALELGAVDCIGKPAAGMAGAFADLAERIVTAASARPRGVTGRVAPPRPAAYRADGTLVLIGASTGGVDALETLLAGYPAHCPPTFITQHMPPAFLASFADRLNSRIAPNLSLAADGMPVPPGQVVLAPGGDTHLAVGDGPIARCRLVHRDKVSGHRPSVDVLFASAAGRAARTVAVLLTGMGRDGAEGMLRLRRAGARCLAQDEESSVVFGMPRAALEAGAAERAVPLPAMAAEILALAGRASGDGGGG